MYSVVLLNVRTVFVDNRTGNGQGDGVTVTQPHDFDILSDGGILRPSFSSIKSLTFLIIVSISENGACPTPK